MRIALLVFFFLFLAAEPVLAQSGRISGRVTDAATRDPIPGANVVIEGTQRGATTSADGYYSIINVPPGTHRLQISFVGYATHIAENVRVSIDEVTTLNVPLREEVIRGEEIVVRAERPVVQPDVSNSRVNVTAEEIQALPVGNVNAVVGLQAGIQEGFIVRGSSADQLSFNVNGLPLRDERNNMPYTNISLCSIQEVQVQTGGFNAEYGNVRSGIVNVVTREGERDRYGACGMVRYRPPGPKHFGPSANDPDSYWIRPFLDPAVAMVGTENGAWDPITRSQYPSFEGWISVSEKWLNDPNLPDMTPEALQQAFLWQHRKSLDITTPDYDVDVGFGGPVPGIGHDLGNLRFHAAYRRSEEAYLIPLHTDQYQEHTGHLKVTSDVARGMKLSVEGRFGDQGGTASSRVGQPGIFRSASGIANQLSLLGAGVGFIDSRIFSHDYWGPTSVRTNQIGGTFTHTLNPSSYYEIRFNRFGSEYETNPGRLRDESPIVEIGGVQFDEAPFGFMPAPSFGVSGMRMGVGWSNARDTSRVTTYNFRADYTTQLNPIVEVKTGLEYNLTDSRVNYGSFDAFLGSSNFRHVWEEQPMRGAAYAQTRLEFRGMIANLGLRADYFHAGGEWYSYDLFEPAFGARPDPLEGLRDLLETEPTARQVTLSPRLGVSFPVTDVSKLYVNYGHFRSMPDPNDLFLIGYFSETGRINRIANPNAPLPRTIAYELGFEQSILEQFLIRTAGYYKDIALEPRTVQYISRNGQVEYFRSEPNQYADIRGFELHVARTRGRWVRGFVNYTYMATTSGYFGLQRQYENPTTQRQYQEDDARNREAQARPVPRPYARLNLDFFTPTDFGPTAAGIRPLADWRLSVLGRWQDGGRYTWVGGGSRPGVLNNVAQRDFINVELRLARTFQVQASELTLFADVYNATNRRHLSFSGFVDGVDRDAYLRSLHLPESPYYDNIVGSDRVGAFRDYSVPFQPMRRIENRTGIAPESHVIYYERASGSWIVYRDGAWAAADPNRVQEVLDARAYIDMPNQSFLAFLNPRNVFVGLRLSF
jgi:hypothetical protein